MHLFSKHLSTGSVQDSAPDTDHVSEQRRRESALVETINTSEFYIMS